MTRVRSGEPVDLESVAYKRRVLSEAGTNISSKCVHLDLGARMVETLVDMPWRSASRRCFSFCQLL